MAGENTVSTLNGLFKEVYASNISQVIPDGVKISKQISFTDAERIGNKYHIPVLLTNEHGFTYLAAGAGVTTLNTQVASVMKDATIDGAQIHLQSAMDYESAAKASSGGEKAFKKATELLVMNMINSMAKRKEISTLYGMIGLGKVSSGTNLSTVATIILTDATWADGIWAGSEGAYVDVYNSSSKVNAHATYPQITGVDIGNKTLTITCGDGTDAANICVAGYDIYWKGSYNAEFWGIDKIVTYTSTSLFGIDTTAYGLWQGNTVNVAAKLTLGAILKGMAKPVGKGLEEDVVLWVPPITYSDLALNEAALRKYDASFSTKATNGFRDIEFYGPNGKITISVSIYIKYGEAFALPMKQFKYIGATDTTFNLPGMSDKDFFFHSQTQNAFFLRAYLNLALACFRPSYCLKFYGITH